MVNQGVPVVIDSTETTLSNHVALLRAGNKQFQETIDICLRDFIKQGRSVNFYALGDPPVTVLTYYKIGDDIFIKACAELYAMNVPAEIIRMHISEMESISEDDFTEEGEDYLTLMLGEIVSNHNDILDSGAYDLSHSMLTKVLAFCGDAGFGVMDILAMKDIIVNGNPYMDDILRFSGILPEVATEDQLESVVGAAAGAGLDESVQMALITLLQQDSGSWQLSPSVQLTEMQCKEFLALLDSEGYESELADRMASLFRIRT